MCKDYNVGLCSLTTEQNNIAPYRCKEAKLLYKQGMWLGKILAKPYYAKFFPKSETAKY
jgi:hypothetical protein